MVLVRIFLLFYLDDVWRGWLYLELFVVVVVRVLSSFV